MTLDELDAPTLARLLGRPVEHVEVMSVAELTNLHVRLRVDGEVLFCKLPPSDPVRRATINATGMGRREALFYSTLAAQLRLRTPVVHAAEHAEDGTFVLLLEDLQSSGCSVSDGTVGVTPDAAAVALEELAAMHVRFESPTRRAAEAPWVQPSGPGSDYAVGMLRFGIEHHRDRLGDAFVALAEVYCERRLDLQALWHGGPQTIVHGDPHLGNVFDDHGRTGFLDWGIVMISTPLRDVSYFLTMAMDVDDRRTHEEALLRHYLDARAGGTPISFDEAWRQHRLQAAYTVPASCQVVMFPEGMTDARRVFSEAFLARAQAAVEDLDALGAIRAAGVS